MRIRSIRPEFWSSEDIAALSWDQRLVFIGLWSYVDDNGVGRDNVRLVVADLFPLDDDPRESVARVSGALQALSGGGQITRYTVTGKPYLHITAWDEHQRIDKRGKDRYPLPTCENAEVRETVATPSRESRDTLAPGEGEKGRRGEETSTPSPATPATPRATPITHGFDQFWEQYPRKVGKQAARKAYATATRTATPARLLLAAKRYASDPNLPAKEFVPHPSTWLNEGRWDDEPLPVRGERPTGPTGPSTSAWDKPAVRSAR